MKMCWFCSKGLTQIMHHSWKLKLFYRRNTSNIPSSEAEAMNTIEQQFRDEIEVERLWITTKQGEFVVFTMLPISLLLIFGLWDTVAHHLLLLWFAMLTLFNLFRWRVLRFYYIHKEALIKDIGKFKHLMLFGSALIGVCWVLGIIWFLVPSEPSNVLIISIALIIQIVGAIATWFCYLPAVMVISLPPILLLLISLFLQGDKISISTGLIFSLMAVLIVITSIKLAKMLNHALLLNYENAALRKESEEKSLLLETALENMAQGISMTDKNDQLRMWNRQFTKLLGSAGEKVAANAYLSAILSAADPPLNVQADGKTKYRLPDGQVYVIRQSTLEQGGRLLTYTDMTDLYNREQALEKASKEAVQANAAKTRFLASASHDLRQPIHALGLFFAELSDRVYSPETALVLGQVEDSISAINSMLNALLDISKLDAQIVLPSTEPVELAELFTRLQSEFQPIASESNNTLSIRMPSVKVNTDPTMLERMLRNLIGNALRYTQNGRVLVAARPRGQQVEIQILDTGRGIPADQLDDIFIEFHQLHNPERDRRQGLGLGLAIVKRLANLLQHDIKVTSNLGRGSCFSINLPLAEEKGYSQPERQGAVTALPNYSLAGHQVLILDDDIAVLKGMEGLLARWGCDVISASSPNEALEKIATCKPKLDLLIVDYRLPNHVSGIDVARYLQNRLGYSVAVLIVTGDTGPERLREAKASGYPLLHKPAQPAKLRSTLQYLLSKSNPAAF
jgi:signal transduction histidine kinase